jgi:hypothetical protein
VGDAHVVVAEALRVVGADLQQIDGIKRPDTLETTLESDLHEHNAARLHLPAVRRRHDARGAVHGGAEVVAIALDGFAGMQPDTHAYDERATARRRARCASSAAPSASRGRAKASPAVEKT